MTRFQFVLLHDQNSLPNQKILKVWLHAAGKGKSPYILHENKTLMIKHTCKTGSFASMILPGRSAG